MMPDFMSRRSGRPIEFSGVRPPLAVLIVDPDRSRAEALARALPPSCVVAVAPSGQAAMDAIRLRIPDLIVTDLDLPDMRGAELIASLHSNAATRHVLLMVVTSRANVQDKIAALLAGADEYLVRPIDTDQFALRVRLVSRFRQLIRH